MRRGGYLKIIDLCLFLFVTSFLLACIIGVDNFQRLKHGLHVRIIDLLIVSVVLVLLRLILLYKRKSLSAKFFQIAPFFLLFLCAAYRYSFVSEYQWGADDSFYYSYVASVVIDHDLDLTNQYQHAGMMSFMDEAFWQRKTVTGLKENIFPVGCSIVWTPFFLIGDRIAHALNALGIKTALDGYSRPYTHTVVFGNLFLVCAGLYVSFLFAAQYFPKWIAMVTVVGMIAATPPLFLFFRLLQLLSEPLSTALIAMELFVLWKYRDRLEIGIWFLLGLLFGFAGTIRYHNLVFLLIPAAVLLLSIGKKESRRAALYSAAAFAIGCFLTFIPQMFAWRLIYGSWLFDLPGTFLIWWKNPYVLETLFSSRKGLFPWTPIVLFSLLGLIFFRKKERLFTGLFWAIFIITIYINSAQRDWWGSVAFGARRFLPLQIFFTLGFASFFDELRKRRRLTGSIFSIAILVFCGLMVQKLEPEALKKNDAPDHAIRFADVFDGRFSSLYKGVVYPLEFPVEAYYHFRYGTSLYDRLNEFFIGEDLFFFQRRAGDRILEKGSPIVGTGWKFEQNQSLSNTSDSAVLNFPMFFKHREDVRIEMLLDLPGAEKDAWIDFSINGNFLRSKKIPEGGKSITLRINKTKYRSSVNRLQLRFYRKRTEGSTFRVLLHEIKFERASEADADDEQPLLDITAREFLNSIAG